MSRKALAAGDGISRRPALNGPRFVAKVAKTFGVTRVNAETLGDFRYEFSHTNRQF